MEIELTETEKEQIRAVLFACMNRAAASFSKIAREHVYLKIPEVQVVEPSKIPHIITEYETTDILVKSDIDGDIQGTSLLLYSNKYADLLIRLCLVPSERFGDRSTEMRESLLLEIANILTGAMVARLADMLKFNVYGLPPVPPPSYNVEFALTKVMKDFSMYHPQIFTVKTQFEDTVHSVKLPLLFVLPIRSLKKMLDAIKQLEAAGIDYLKTASRVQ